MTDKYHKGKRLGDALSEILYRYPEVTLFCFDYFDTLVYRIVEPEQTKRLACRQLSIVLGGDPDAGALYQWRKNFELTLCGENEKKGLDPEFSLYDLAAVFHEFLVPRYPRITGLYDKDRFVDLFIQIEMNIELRVQKTFPDTGTLLSIVKKHGASVVLISDFYIPGDLFRRFLDRHGISKYIDHLFVSCDYGLTKFTGRLYDTVINHYRVKPETFLMIGDRENADVRMPASRKMKSMGVGGYTRQGAASETTTVQPPHTFESITSKKRFPSLIVKNQKDLFPEFALTLWHFIYRLFQELIRENATQVFFLSKEGAFLKQLFDQFQQEQFGTAVIDSRHLRVSRKSTFIGSLRAIESEDFSRLFSQYNTISPRDFLLSLNFQENEAKRICDASSIPYDVREGDFSTSDTFRFLLQSKEFRESYEEKRRRQKTAFLKYLESFDVDFTKARLHLVDVGWKGTIQDNMYFTLNREADIRGYYMGTITPTHLFRNNPKKGLLFSNYPVKTPYYDVYAENPSLFEVLLSNPEGSADAYEIRNAAGKPKQRSVEGEFDAGNGIVVKMNITPEEKALFFEKIAPFQDAVRTDFKRFSESQVISESPPPDDEWFARKHARMIFYPRPKEISFFQSVFHFENFGNIEFTGFHGGSRVSLRKKIQNLITVLSAPKPILESFFWYPVTLDRMGLGGLTGYFGRRFYRKVFSENGTAKWLTQERMKRSLFRFRVKKKLRIALLFDKIQSDAQSKKILTYAIKLKRAGHPVAVITKSNTASVPSDFDWFSIQQTRNLKFDLAAAASWESALLLEHIPADAYAYFLTDPSSVIPASPDDPPYDHSAMKRLAIRSHLFPVPVITTDPGIREYFEENLGRKVFFIQESKTFEKKFASVLRKIQRQSGPSLAYLKTLIDLAWKGFDSDQKIEAVAPLFGSPGESTQKFQLYWHHGDGFAETRSWSKDYAYGKWVTFSTDIPSAAAQVWLRLDPAVHWGVVFIEFIRLLIPGKPKPLISWDPQQGWAGIEAKGTSDLLSKKDILVLESTGRDPQVLLPPIQIDESTRPITVEIRLRFIHHRQSIREAFDEKGAISA